MASSSSSPGPASPSTARAGVLHKPLIEKLKLIALFAVIGALVYLSKPTPATFGIGTVLVVIGTLIRVWAAGHLTRDQQLTTSGPYQHSRNPFYLGRLFLIVGFAVMSGLTTDFSQTRIKVIWAILIFALGIFFFVYMPRKEEREGGRLRDLFGPDYEQWKDSVPQLFPRLTPYVMHPKPWSRELFMGGDANYTGNKELWTTLVIIGLVVLFAMRMSF